MKEQRQRLRLFVCMKTRTDGRPCCAYQGAAIVLDELRREILVRGEQCSHIDVRPSGCLDRCEDGPVVMAFYGQLAEEATPSRELIKESLDDAAYRFTAVSARDVSTILDTVLEGIDGGELTPMSRRHWRDREVASELRELKCGLSR
jgi:(2Fe-2S) ferredoxin